MITSSNSLSRGSGMPNQVDGAFVRAPCPVPSCPACEPNSGSVLPSLSTKAYSSRAGRHCYAIRCPNSAKAATKLNSRLQEFALRDGCTSLFWALADQRQRCPVCLRLLSNPTRIGNSAQLVLGSYGAELMCNRGHGSLYVPTVPTSWCSSQRWQYLDLQR
jgi:hypothetical protein